MPPRKLSYKFILLILTVELFGFWFARPLLAATTAATTTTQKNSCQQLEARFKAINPDGSGFTDPKSSTDIYPKYCTVTDVMKKALNTLFALSGTAAVLFIVLGGFQYMTSAGNQEQADKGKKTLMYAVIGLIIIILATTIVNILVKLITS